MTINLNEFVKVKLNNYGKVIYCHQHDELNEFIKSKGCKPLEPLLPKVDEDGYTEFQLWELMKLYGPHIGMGLPTPFEMNVVVYVGEHRKED